MQSEDPNKQNIRKCINQADYTFMNNGTLEELNQQVDEVMKKMS
jgi:dephospho-CoA kinase